MRNMQQVFCYCTVWGKAYWIISALLLNLCLHNEFLYVFQPNVVNKNLLASLVSVFQPAPSNLITYGRIIIKFNSSGFTKI